MIHTDSKYKKYQKNKKTRPYKNIGTKSVDQKKKKKKSSHK